MDVYLYSMFGGETTYPTHSESQLTIVHKACAILQLTAFLCAAVVAALFIWEHASFNSAEIVLETDYLHWVTSFPAISACELPNASLPAARQAAGGGERQQLEAFLHGLARPAARYCRNCSASQPCAACNRLAASPDAALAEVLSPCEQLFAACRWNGRPLDCCANFRRLATSRGVCFSLNSRHTDGSANVSDLVVTQSKPQANLHLQFTKPVQVFAHDPGDLAFLRARPRGVRVLARWPAGPQQQQQQRQEPPAHAARPGQHRVLAVGVREVRAHPDAGLLTRAQRGCALPGEQRPRAHRADSESACVAECRARAQLRRCNCSHPLLPRFGGDQPCNYDGLQCLDLHFRSGDKRARHKLKCRCLPDCAVADIRTVQDSVFAAAGELAQTTVRLVAPPTERLTLTARVNTVDVIVGVACLSRLVMSGSLPGAAVWLAALLLQLAGPGRGRTRGPPPALAPSELL